jgi:Protein of unknown function (DUF2946)
VSTFRRSMLRQAIGWIVAYALALQTILAGLVVTPNASADTLLGFHSDAIICLTSHGADPDQSDPDGTHHNSHPGWHCGLCAASMSAVAPTAVSVAALLAPGLSLVLPVLPAGKVDRSLNSLPGRPRAPPTIA